MKNLDKPHHGWEGLTNGGEIYGSQIGKTKEERKEEYLKLVKLALEISMNGEPKSYEKAKEILKEAEFKYSDILDEELEIHNFRK